MPRTSMSIPAIEFHAIQMPLGPHEESHRYSLLWVIDILARVYRFFYQSISNILPSHATLIMMFYIPYMIF